MASVLSTKKEGTRVAHSPIVDPWTAYNGWVWLVGGGDIGRGANWS